MPVLDWNPESYSRFKTLRLRPAIDLAAQVGRDLPPGDIIDLGCGTGVAGPMLVRQHPGRRLVGVDNSPAMIEEAAALDCYDRLEQADAARWQPATPPALIYSNAVLHWLDDHRQLLPRLADMLAPGGALAIQVPNQTGAPSHSSWFALRDEVAPGCGAAPRMPRVLEGREYFDLLAPYGEVNVWETEYFQQLASWDMGHPVRQFTADTIARPVLSDLSAAEIAELTSRYDAAMERAYPRGSDGSVLFPFRRLFVVLHRAKPGGQA